MTRVAALVIAPVIVLALYGCVPESRIEASVVNDRVVFAICDSIEVDSVRVDGFSTDASPGDEKVLWQISGEGFWPAGYKLALGVAPEAWVTEAEVLPVDLASEEIYIVLNPPETTETADTRVATFDPTLLDEGKWLSQTGELRNRPCS